MFYLFFRLILKIALYYMLLFEAFFLLLQSKMREKTSFGNKYINE